ncbi:alcohol dehydrogenase zinc-binding domain protein [Thozetella sp. PMI_491]|nr:alcohol dehydrogenase zinc-binding domain protein [Thozetella sp. PMI_491]
MKAIVLHEHGGLEKLSYEEVPDPILGPAEVLIRVYACGLNHVDIDVRNGVSGVESIQTLPHIPGVDAVGQIEAIGPEVTLWKVGDRILGLTHWGGYSEKVVVKEHHLVGLPGNVSYQDAAAAMTPFATAWEALIVTAGLRAGETVMITGAGGGVGSHAVQVAALAGARVIASVGASDKVEKVRALGASDVINYREESLADGVLRVTNGRGVDVVFDGIGGEILKASIKSLVDGGRIASIGAHGGEIVDIDMIQVFRKHITIFGCGRSTREIASKVLELMAQGKLKAIVHGSFPLEKAAEAQKLMESRQFFGRIILTM